MIKLIKRFIATIKDVLDDLLCDDMEKEFLNPYSDKDISYIPEGVTSMKIAVPGTSLLDEEAWDTIFFKSQADRFKDKIRDDHRIPDVNDRDTWKAVGASIVTFTESPFGHYPITKITFNDGSVWEKYAN